ncbi:MAG TPA: creatininase family protein [Chloroflexota bacterium]|nr:creatininase family protein [Chloroflexota bacterium]
MATGTILLHELTRAELRALALNALVVLPLGATEQHGPHLPAGTDALIVEHIARASAAEAARRMPVVVAPTVSFGASHHHLPFGATLSFGTETFYRAIRDLVESLISGGFSRIFILNGHGGNEDLSRQVAHDLALAHPVSIATAAYWTIGGSPLAAECARRGANLPGHAGAFETALLLALRPDLVVEPRPHRDRPADARPADQRPAYQAAVHNSWQAIDGFTDSPDQATAEAGRGYLDLIVSAVTEAFLDFHGRR